MGRPPLAAARPAAQGIVKRFFNEKEVTSTLVMDALFSGCQQIEAATAVGPTALVVPAAGPLPPNHTLSLQPLMQHRLLLHRHRGLPPRAVGFQQALVADSSRVRQAFSPRMWAPQAGGAAPVVADAEEGVVRLQGDLLALLHTTAAQPPLPPAPNQVAAPLALSRSPTAGQAGSAARCDTRLSARRQADLPVARLAFASCRLGTC